MSTTVKTLEVPGYQVAQFLGSGARSTIWQIRDSRTGDLYAMKRVVRRETSDRRFLEQAENEHAVANRLDHPSVRKIYDIRHIRRWLAVREIHLVMEYCRGRTVQDSRPQSVMDAVEVFSHVAAALEHMNSRSLVHADTKPNNILVADDGTVKIIDLGQSCRVGTIKKRIQGTPDFIAPEQVHRQPLDSRTDVFNFGASLYWTLTGQAIPTILPKKGEVTLKIDLIVTPPEQLNPDVPSGLNKLISDCIEISPARRPQSMKEVRSRLEMVHSTLTRSRRGDTGQDIGDEDTSDQDTSGQDILNQSIPDQDI